MREPGKLKLDLGSTPVACGTGTADMTVEWKIQSYVLDKKNSRSGDLRHETQRCDRRGERTASCTDRIRDRAVVGGGHPQRQPEGRRVRRDRPCHLDVRERVEQCRHVPDRPECRHGVHRPAAPLIGWPGPMPTQRGSVSERGIPIDGAQLASRRSPGSLRRGRARCARRERPAYARYSSLGQAIEAT